MFEKILLYDVVFLVIEYPYLALTEREILQSWYVWLVYVCYYVEYYVAKYWLFFFGIIKWKDNFKW